MNIRTELLEHLVRQCVREVLDQVDAKSGPAGKKKAFVKEGDLPMDPNEQPGGETGAPPGEKPTAEEPPTSADKPEQPDEPSEPPPPSVKGAVLVNPKDKSKLQAIKFNGRDETAIERTLHHVAASIAGNRTKVSIGAKRLGREAANNPNSSVYFYFGKMDPESEEIFLLADKSLQIAKDDSVQPGELTGTPVSALPPDKYDVPGRNPDEVGYNSYKRKLGLATPTYGIDENAKKMIKAVVNQILDGKK